MQELLLKNKCFFEAPQNVAYTVILRYNSPPWSVYKVKLPLGKKKKKGVSSVPLCLIVWHKLEVPKNMTNYYLE